MIFKQQQTGASLLEVLISLSLLVGGVLAYFQLDASLISSNHMASQKAEATQLLQQQIALLASSRNVADSGIMTTSLNSHTYNVSWNIKNSSLGRAVNVNIDWKDHRGKPSDQTHLELTGYYAHIDALVLSLLPPPVPIHP